VITLSTGRLVGSVTLDVTPNEIALTK